MADSRILHLIDSAGMYGAERVVISLLAELRTSRFPGVLGCIREVEGQIPPIAEEAERCGVEVAFFTMGRGFSRHGLRQIAAFSAKHRIRVIHSHGYKPNIMLCVGRPRGTRVLSTVHGWAKHTASLKGRLYEYADAVALRRLDMVVAVSRAVERDLASRGVAERRVTVIHNGIACPADRGATEPVDLRGKIGLPKTAFVIGAVGRLVAVKGYEYLIDAMQEVGRVIPESHLVIAGEGPLLDPLRGRVERHGLAQRVTFAGYQSEIRRFLAMLDVFVMPSLSEGLPMALLEALCCGKAAIGTSVGGIPEVISNRENGILIPPSDSRSIAKGIVEIHGDEAFKALLSHRGRESVEKDFSSDAMARKYSSLYHGMLD